MVQRSMWEHQASTHARFVETNKPKHVNDCDFVIRKHRLYIRGRCFRRFNHVHYYTSILLSVLKIFGPGKVPDVIVRIDVKDCKPATVPSLGWCGHIKRGDYKGFAEQTDQLLVPGYHEAPCVGEGSFTAFGSLYNQQEPLPWSQREAKLVWRGSPTGLGPWKPQRPFSGEPMSTRLRLALMSGEKPDFIDAALIVSSNRSTWLQLAKHPSGRIGWIYTDRGKSLFMNDTTTSSYKYIADPEGDGCSSRFVKDLARGSVVFKYFSRGVNWHAVGLKPWVHYVPVRKDFLDVLERIKWLRQNDARAEQIAKAARQFALTQGSQLCVAKYWLDVLQLLARHQTRKVEASKEDVEVPLPSGGHPNLLYAVKIIDTKSRSQYLKCWLADAPLPSMNDNTTRSFWRVKGLSISDLESPSNLPRKVKFHGANEPNPNHCKDKIHC